MYRQVLLRDNHIIGLWIKILTIVGTKISERGYTLYDMRYFNEYFDIYVDGLGLF